jgi:hypothetical protein
VAHPQERGKDEFAMDSDYAIFGALSGKVKNPLKSKKVGFITYARKPPHASRTASVGRANKKRLEEKEGRCPRSTSPTPGAVPTGACCTS